MIFSNYSFKSLKNANKYELSSILFDIAVPPEIHPERLNMTANIDETIILTCNTTGVPEPVVSWVKMPNVDIIGNEESEISIISEKYLNL